MIFSCFVFSCYPFVFRLRSYNIINFVDVEYSRRVNPIQAKYINNLAAASETAETLLESLQKGKKEGGGGSDQFFQPPCGQDYGWMRLWRIPAHRVPKVKGGMTAESLR